MWTMLAAARQEQFGLAPSVGGVTDPVTNALVVSTPATPLLEPLQRIPIIGPLFVTPVVSAINHIPILGDILHPLFGYPLQRGLPAGTPVARDVKVTSFDGTQIYVHFMPAAGLQPGQSAPTILNGPGLGMPGATNLNGALLDGILEDNIGMVSIATLRPAGYNVVTWDPRGEYFSGGVLQIDSPDFEARDVSTIISWVAQQPEAELDGAGDPRMGMVGASYGGGIQLTTAASDHRIDAIVPTIAWNTLNTSLYKNDRFKSGWGTLLAGALELTLARINPRIIPAAIYGDRTGMLAPSDQDLLAERGPGGIRGFPDLVSQITAPTLLIQGTVDTLFTLQEADANAKDLIAHGVPTKVLWFCGGHGLCVNNLGDKSDGALIQLRTLEWLDRYVKDDPTVSTGPQFEYVDQAGQYFQSNVYPVTPGKATVATDSTARALRLSPYGGSGALFGVLPIGATKARRALDFTVPATTTTTYIVGAPTLTLNYSGTGFATHVYAQLVDDSTGRVLGNQVTPIPVTLDGLPQKVTISLEPVVETLRPGQTVTLQLTGSAADYASVGSWGQLNVSSMQISLPTADPSAMSPESVAGLATVA
jgi:ABC-2 type transport system ATP-binding protein